MWKGNEVRVRLIAWLAVNALLLIFTILVVYPLLIHRTGIVCPIHYRTGLNCPGCGGTRMLVAFLRLEFYQALRFNAYLALSLIPMLLLYFRESYLFIRYNVLSSSLDRVLILWATGFLIFGIIRNLPMFYYLSPTIVK